MTVFDPELKPCPFCGSSLVRVTTDDDDTYVECDICGGRTQDTVSAPIAVALWNRRDEMDKATALILKYHEELKKLKRRLAAKHKEKK